MSSTYAPILVVEDVPNVLELLDVTLRFKGYPVITARNGLEALELIPLQRPSLIITDILMPKMDGYTFVQKLRTNEATRDIPVIFLSATYVTSEDKEFALSLGAAKFLEKPIDTEEFLLTIAELIAQGPLTPSQPLGSEKFYLGYRERLETKLRHKSTQITRIERLLTTLPDEQKLAFEAMLKQAHTDREEILNELNEVYSILDEFKAVREEQAQQQRT